jgi:hypothetical protein
MTNGSETVKEAPIHVEKVEVEGKSLPMSPTASKVSVDEHDLARFRK